MSPSTDTWQRKVEQEILRHGILLEADAQLPSVVALVAGEPIRGSWWGHPRGHDIFHACQHLREHDEIVTAKLVSKKVTYVHRNLWAMLVADGEWNPVEFEVPLRQSSWIALRIYPSSHTNPVFALIGDRPIRASARSAEWCRDAVDRCWEMKHSQIREAEREAAERAYDQARETYDRILEEARAREDE